MEVSSPAELVDFVVLMARKKSDSLKIRSGLLVEHRRFCHPREKQS
jgi:hypothetical protein